jgi:DNA-binding NarL/FixJ family response regulator
LTLKRDRRNTVSKVTPVISIVIAAREKAGRAASRRLLESQKDIRVVGEARSGLDAATAAEKLKPSIMLLDLALFDADSTALLPVIRRKSPRTRVLLLSDSTPEALTLEALSHGARGFLDKATLGTYLSRAVRAVNAGEAWVPRKMVAKIMDRLARLTMPGPASCG